VVRVQEEVAVMRARQEALFAVTSLDEGEGDNLTVPESALCWRRSYDMLCRLLFPLCPALSSLAPALDDC
jgi:hypothetical protein